MQIHVYALKVMTTALLTGSIAAGTAQAGNKQTAGMRQTSAAAGTAQYQHTDKARAASQQVSDATDVITDMKQQADVQQLMERAHGFFILPRYGRGAAVVGARGGEGVLVVRNDGGWAGPAFYDYGGLSIGAQLGGKSGSIVMLLMSERAVDRFKREADFSLNADAGLTIAEYSENAPASLSNTDVVVWSDIKGLFAGGAIGVTGVRRDADDNRAYYNQAVTAEQIFKGAVTNPNAHELYSELPHQVALR